MLQWGVYIALGGSFTIGQMLISEIGKYETWGKKRRALVGSFFGVFTFLASFLPMVFFEEWTYPVFLLGIVALEKALVSFLNRVMPERFQATKEELKKKYEDMLKIDGAEVEEVIKEEKEFIEKLGFTTKREDFKSSADAELEELGNAARRFMRSEKT